jgi:hypothetical protein
MKARLLCKDGVAEEVRVRVKVDACMVLQAFKKSRDATTVSLIGRAPLEAKSVRFLRSDKVMHNPTRVDLASKTADGRGRDRRTSH